MWVKAMMGWVHYRTHYSVPLSVSCLCVLLGVYEVCVLHVPQGGYMLMPLLLLFVRRARTVITSLFEGGLEARYIVFPHASRFLLLLLCIS